MRKFKKGESYRPIVRIAKVKEDGNFKLSNKNDFRDYKVTFTETEITELEKEHDLSMFVKEEVE